MYKRVSCLILIFEECYLSVIFQNASIRGNLKYGKLLPGFLPHTFLIFSGTFLHTCLQHWEVCGQWIALSLSRRTGKGSHRSLERMIFWTVNIKKCIELWLSWQNWFIGSRRVSWVSCIQGMLVTSPVNTSTNKTSLNLYRDISMHCLTSNHYWTWKWSQIKVNIVQKWNKLFTVKIPTRWHKIGSRWTLWWSCLFSICLLTYINIYQKYEYVELDDQLGDIYRYIRETQTSWTRWALWWSWHM